MYDLRSICGNNDAWSQMISYKMQWRNKQYAFGENIHDDATDGGR